MKKILIVVIILVAAFSMYNFSMTGDITKSKTTIDFAPKEIKTGQTINIDLAPSKGGVDILMTVHAKNGLRKDSTDEWGHDCANYKRTSTGTKCRYPWKFDYRIPKSLMPGQYYFRFYDYEETDFVASTFFTVVE